mmetsp:Transcript_17421/g.32871  ORF Transcript_17421/g.32871 Transcript_17421/m.32871 type:complete len:527 (-) Transcript_17421:26-1606(-)
MGAPKAGRGSKKNKASAASAAASEDAATEETPAASPAKPFPTQTALALLGLGLAVIFSYQYRGLFFRLFGFVYFMLVAFSVVALLVLLAIAVLVGIGLSQGGKQMRKAVDDTFLYYRALYYFWVKAGTLADCQLFAGHPRQAKLQIFSLTLIMHLWDKPHYRNGSFQHDMLKNLRNVALPGTGMPLHWVVQTKILGYAFLLIAYPLIAVASALIRCWPLDFKNLEPVAAIYSEQLLCPQDWFSFWQLNCRLATWHSFVTKETDYRMEDKLEFLKTAEALDIAVTPCMKVPAIVCKHRNEEGGLGFASFRNALSDGDWIIQEKLGNGPFLASMLPDDAPLSTFRIISASRGGLLSGTSERGSVKMEDINALSCVWRAGLQGAATDHSSILFNVDPKTGEIKKGTTNNHWYQRGFKKIFTTPRTSEHSTTHHPDGAIPITGKKVPDMKKLMNFVSDAHLRMMPHVPLAGWDIAFVGDDNKMILLEANLSCNFFRGDFDQDAYFKFIEDYFLELEKREKASGTTPSTAE